MPKIKCIVAHPDDEIIWAGPLLREHKTLLKVARKVRPPSWHINKVVCLTCQDHSKRSAEFKNCAKHYGFQYSFFNTPISRKLSFKELMDIWKIISSEFDNEIDICVTHAIYGDDHFHPQHMLISLVCLVNSFSRGIPLIFSHSSKPLFLVLKDAFVRTDFTIKSFIFLPIKVVAIFLSYLISSPYIVASADIADIKCAKEIYSSQSFDYKNIHDNKFRFRKRIGVTSFKL